MCVIGLGAIGGSIARRAAAEGGKRIVGFARDRNDAVAAAEAGAIHDVADSVPAAIRNVEMVVLAAPPRANLSLLSDIAPGVAASGALVTDVTSVKTAIANRAVALDMAERYAGSHPLAGTHETGFAASHEDMFVGTTAYVVPVDGGRDAHDDVRDFWKTMMGANPVSIDAPSHDRLLAWTSHLPQAVASSLAVTLAAGVPPDAPVGPGARSTTRLAASSIDLWTDILMQNRDAVLPALDAMVAAQVRLRTVLETDDVSGLRDWLERGALWRQGIDG